MNVDRIRTLLESQAEQLLELANMLGRSGKPLTQRQKQMIRAATLPIVQEIAEQMIINRLQGVTPDLEHIASELAMIFFK